jgi:AcrR family transcriptional regulator
MGRPTVPRKPGIHEKRRIPAARGRGESWSPARVRPGARGGEQGGDPAGLRKTPRQGRSQRIVETVLEAAALTFAELGYAKATTNRIAERAGISVGSLYQYFPSKDGILARLLAAHKAQIHALVEQAVARLADPAAPLEATLRALLEELVEVHRASPAMARALSEAVLRQSSALDQCELDGEDVAQASMVRAALEARPDVRSGDLEAMAAVLGRTTSQLTRWLVHDAPPELDRAMLLEEAVQLLVRYLRR